MDLKTLIKPLSELYGLEAVEGAIKTLKAWYEDEAYDDDDIKEDWDGSFEDSEGIDKLVEALKFNDLMNSEENKRTLYMYCRYYLFPDQPVPKKPMKHQIADNEPIDDVYQEFKRKLKEKLHLNPVDAEKIADVFIHHVKEEEYDMEGVEGDLENEDESEIIDNIITKFPKLENRKTKIFDILSSITNKEEIAQISSKAPIYEDLALKMQSTEQHKDDVVKLCKKWLGGMFETKETQSVDEKSFIYAKSWDISNQFPWLSSMCDTFSRFKLESHKKNCEENKDDELNVNDKFVNMKPDEWFTKIDPECNKLIQADPKNANYLKHGMMACFKRLMPEPNLNYKLDFTIWDSLDVFARYAISFNEFIYTISTSSTLQCTPIQFDFLIIPKCCSKSCYQSLELYDELYDHMPSFLQTEPKKPSHSVSDASDEPEYTCFETGAKDDAMSNDNKTNHDDDDDDDDDDEDYNQNTLNNTASTTSVLWDIEQSSLIPSGYVKDKDYFGPIGLEREVININRMVKILNENLFRNVKDGDNARFKRYIFVIDRRNPKNLKHKKMTYIEESNKKWPDRIYLICPKQANKICPDYQYKLNETFMQNLKDLLLPLPTAIKNEKIPHFGALSSGGGYKFVLSYQVHSEEKVKTYWYLNGGAQRFFINDIEWLWERYFVKKNKHKDFQQLTETTKQALQRAKNEHRLMDKQFTRYRQGYKLIT